jgi:tryptophanyl-tRNA synthetase
MLATFAPMRARAAELGADPATVDAILERGAERARAIAATTLRETKRLMGFHGAS